MAMVPAKKGTTFYFYNLDCRFLEKSHGISVSILLATEYEAESNDCVCVISARSTSVDGDGTSEETNNFSY